MRVQTELGDIVLELDAKRAPNTTANFLKYMDAGHYDGGTFHRTVKMNNQPESPVKIEVIQAGVAADKAKQGFPAIPLERNNVSGILHKDGVVSMAGARPTAPRQDGSLPSTISRHLILAGRAIPMAGLRGLRRVVSGMEVVRKIQAAPRRPTCPANKCWSFTPSIRRSLTIWRSCWLARTRK